MSKVSHFEIPADDLARAKEFYGSIFAWELQDFEMENGTYTIVQTVPVDEEQLPTEPGAINGGIFRRTAQTPHPVITVTVDGIQDALEKIEAAGGSTVTPRTEIPNMGAFAYFKDPEGNTLGLWENL